MSTKKEDENGKEKVTQSCRDVVGWCSFFLVESNY
jgi:hypothetical protein